MDFFDRQENARRHTKRLELYFVLAVISIVLMTYVVIALFIGFEAGKIFSPAFVLEPAIVPGGQHADAGIHLLRQRLQDDATCRRRQRRGRNAGRTPDRLQHHRSRRTQVARTWSRKWPSPPARPSRRSMFCRRNSGINAFAAGHSTKRHGHLRHARLPQVLSSAMNCRASSGMSSATS